MCFGPDATWAKAGKHPRQLWGSTIVKEKKKLVGILSGLSGKT